MFVFIRAQHKGFGKQLLSIAEVLTLSQGLNKIAVISGIGTREYYRKFGYEIENLYMTKQLEPEDVYRRAFIELNISQDLQIQRYNLETNLGPLNSLHTDHTTSETRSNVKRNHQLKKQHCYIQPSLQISQSQLLHTFHITYPQKHKTRMFNNVLYNRQAWCLFTISCITLLGLVFPRLGRYRKHS